MARVHATVSSAVLLLMASVCESMSMAPCEHALGHMLHLETRYLAGSVHRDGSIFAKCHNGTLKCYEDHALADAPLSEHSQVNCSSTLIHSRRRRLGLYVSDSAKVWPHGVVPYRIASNFTDEQKGHIMQAMANVVDQSGINVRFVDCETSECGEDFVDIVNKQKGCFSKVGYMKQGAQVLNLGASCFKNGSGTPMHEFLHALGVFHEHIHPQRKVIVLSDMKLPVATSNYVKKAEALTLAYDLGSIMHYSRTSGVCVPLDATPLDSFCDVTNPHEGCLMPTKEHCDDSKDNEFGQRKALSEGDTRVLRSLYANVNPLEPGEPNSQQPSNPPQETPPALTGEPASIGEPWIDAETPEIWD